MKTSNSNYPAFKLLVLLAVSIYINILLNLNYIFIFILILSILDLIAIFAFYNKKYFNNILYYITVFLVGSLLANSLNSIKIQTPAKIIPEYSALISGKVTQILKNDTNYLICIIRGNVDAKVLPDLNNIGVLLKLKGDKERLNFIKSGHYINANVKIRTPETKVFPSDFPEDTYCSSMDVAFIARANIENVAIRYLDDYSLYIRDEIIKDAEIRFSEYFSDEILAIVNALILGDKSAVSPEIKQLYSLSGTAHVLALSGLHIGILAIGLSLITGFIQNRYLKFIFVVFIIIFYTFVTGMQASAVRAAVGAILVIFANIVQRKANLINILSIVVILSISIDVSLILNAGFQMSVVSVFGILFFYDNFKDKLYSLIKGEFYLFKYLREALALTLSATVCVTPIVAYYFSSFSIISPVTNLFVVPLMNGALVFGVITLIFSYICPILAPAYSGITEMLIKCSNYINGLAIKVPWAYYSSADAFYISIFISLIILYLFYVYNWKLLIFRSAVSIIFITIIFLHIKPEKTNNIEIFVRPQFTAAFVPGENYKSIVYVCDRKPAIKPYADKSFEAYLLEKKDSLKVIITGNFGINLTDRIKDKSKIKIIEADNILQRQIEKRIFEGQRFCRIIERKEL